MSDKEKKPQAEVIEEAPQSGAQIEQKPEPTFFEFGDAFFECNRCGNYERIQKGIKDGLQFVLPTSDQHEWRLVCGKCKNMMRIFFKESDEETTKEAKEQIAKQEAEQKKQAEEAALEKAKKEAKDESKKKDKKEGPTKGSTKDTTGVHESDGKGEPTLNVVD